MVGANRPWLLVERLGDEVLVYDQRTHRAHAVRGVAAWLFEHDDGRPAHVLARSSQFSVAEINSGRDLLEALDLGRAADRRRTRRRVFTAAALAALATTLVAPTKAAAASVCPGSIPCTISTLGSKCSLPLGVCGTCSGVYSQGVLSGATCL